MKHPAPNAGDAIRNGDAGQAAATLKGSVSNAGDAARNRNGTGFASWASNEGGLIFTIQNPI